MKIEERLQFEYHLLIPFSKQNLNAVAAFNTQSNAWDPRRKKQAVWRQELLVQKSKKSDLCEIFTKAFD